MISKKPAVMKWSIVLPMQNFMEINYTSGTLESCADAQAHNLTFCATKLRS